MRICVTRYSVILDLGTLLRPGKHSKEFHWVRILFKRLSKLFWDLLRVRVIFSNSKNMYALMNAGTSLTKVITDYWTSYSNDQKLQIRMSSIRYWYLGDFVLEYLIKHGSELPTYLVTCLSALICRITSLSWMTDQRQRNILNQMLEYTQSRVHCILALQVLEELVNQINPNSRIIVAIIICRKE